MAYLFKSAGYDVIGVFIKMWYPEGEEWTNTRDNLCCDISTILGVKQVASQLDIPLYVIDMAQEFKERVVDNYIEEYEQGRTPNPCSKCNKFIKLGFLWEKAQQYGAQYLATGHYVTNSNGGIARATDTKKDQTYFLWEIEAQVVPHLLFPLGTLTKPEVREIAKAANLPVFDKEESQGTCFIVEKNNKKFLQVYAKRLTVPGEVVDEKGNVLGEHRGLVFYTIGQREGLGDEVAGKYMKNHKGDTAGTDAPKLYVKSINVERNQLIVAENNELFETHLTAKEINILDQRLTSLIGSELDVQIRGGHKPDRARLTKLDLNTSTFTVEFLDSVRAITPGQSAVLFCDGQLLGGGIIV